MKLLYDQLINTHGGIQPIEKTGWQLNACCLNMVDAIAETTVSVWVTNTDARLAIRDGDKWGEHEATVVINFCPFCGLQIVSESADIMKEVEESVVIPERVVNKVKLVKVDADG